MVERGSKGRSVPSAGVSSRRRVMVAFLCVAAAAARATPVESRWLTGIVVDASGGALSGAEVALDDGVGRPVASTQTSAVGEFRVEVRATGDLTLRVRHPGFEPARLPIHVRAGQVLEPVRVALSLAALSESVSLEASTATRRSATAATRFDADLLAVPQSTQSVTSAMIEARGDVDVGDVLQQVPSAFSGHTRLAPFTSFSWRVRGLDAGVTRNGFRQLYFEDVDQSAFLNVERVEIVKGPGGAVAGKEGLGGLIHIVTKRPAREFGAALYLDMGTFEARRGGVDVTGPLGASGLALRVNGELERSGSFVEHQDVDRGNAAVGASWDRGRAVRVFVNAEYQRRTSLPHPGLPVAGTVLRGAGSRVARERYLGEPALDFLKTWSPLVQAWLEIDLGHGWTLSPRYQRFTFNVDQQQMRLRAPSSTAPRLIQRAGRFDFHERDRTHTGQLELHGHARLGPTTHQVVVGYERNAHDYTGGWFDYVGTPPIDALAPAYLSVAPARSATRTTFSGSIDTHEPYVQDLIGWKRLDVLLGLRRTDVRIDSEFLGLLTPDQNHAGTAYQAGVAYRVAAGWSLFAGTSSGLSVDNVVGATAADGAPFEPERSRQVEAGLKHQTARTSASAAYFDVRFDNATTTDPVNPDFSLQVGAQRSRGVELEGTLQGGARWLLAAGLAFMDATVTRGNADEVGRRLPNVARFQANAWGRFQAHEWLQLALGLRAVGRRFGSLDNAYELPGYLTLDASASVRLSTALMLEVFAQNVADETYFTGNSSVTVYPGEPRSVYARLRLRHGRR